MHDDFDVDLSPEQWEILKALRCPASQYRFSKTRAVEVLVKLGLVAVRDGEPVITSSGRKVLVRGSCRLLDLAA
jgi:hypothetical protein